MPRVTSTEGVSRELTHTLTYSGADVRRVLVAHAVRSGFIPAAEKAAADADGPVRVNVSTELLFSGDGGEGETITLVRRVVTLTGSLA